MDIINVILGLVIYHKVISPLYFKLYALLWNGRHKHHYKIQFPQQKGNKTKFFCKECKVGYWFEIGSDE